MKTNTPILTVAIPTWNRAQALDNCLRSVCANLPNGIEVLVSDNASTDNTGKIVA